MRALRFSLILGVLLLAGGLSSSQAAVADINSYAGTYSGYFYLRLNSGDYRSYALELKVRRGTGGVSTKLSVDAKITSAGVVSYATGFMNANGIFSVVQIPGQTGSKLRTFSAGGRARYKVNDTGGVGVFQFVHPDNNPSQKLDAKTQNGLISPLIKYTSKTAK